MVCVGLHPGEIVFQGPKVNLELSMSLMFLNCGIQLKKTEKAHASTWTTCKLKAERP